jgi:hypothetical protein
MSAIFGAFVLFYALAFVGLTLALAADSGSALWSRSQHTEQLPAVAVNVDSMSDDERILTTRVAATAPAETGSQDQDAARAA